MSLPKGWTQAKFNSFIKNALRSATMKWPPKYEVKKKARTKRGWYLCNGCKEEIPASIQAEAKKGKKRKSNTYIDHIEPIIDPYIGFVDWNTVIERMFVGEEGLQLLCKMCHDIKTKKERSIAKDRNNEQRDKDV